MTLSSYSDVFGVIHEQAPAGVIEPGAIVATGPSDYPRFEVVAVDDGQAWVRNVLTGANGFAHVNRCRVITPVAARKAA